jgi:hypothetical protein
VRLLQNNERGFPLIFKITVVELDVFYVEGIFFGITIGNRILVMELKLKIGTGD